MSQETFPCPKCGMPVSKGDTSCKNCGADFLQVSAPPAPPSPSVPEVPAEKPYERKFSSVERLLRVLISPSAAMEDIGLAPDYEGASIVIVFLMILAAVAMVLAFQKIQVVGDLASQVWSLVSGIIVFAVVLSFGVMIVRWLVKSFLVRLGCDSGSGWNFKTAAVVTGYAYMADVIVAILSLLVLWSVMPSFTINTANLDAAQADLANFQAQLRWIKLVYSLPVSLLGLVWKSYLGGLGAHFGTKRACSKGTGFIVFFVLGLIGLLITYGLGW